jgi:transmembrane sensor
LINSRIDPSILGEAADWLVQLQSGSATEDDYRAVQAWCQRSAQHAQAWQRAEMLLGDLRRLPVPVTGETLRRLSRNGAVSRRQAVQRLGLMLLAAPAAWLALRETPWQQWTADAHTAVGEQRPLTLADGSRVLLNTDSAVDIRFDARQRCIDLLAGEILVTSAADPATPARPLRVRTLHGKVQAVGTRFSVRLAGPSTQVAVLEGAVAVQPQHGTDQLLRAGERSTFDAARVQPAIPLDVGDLAWERGMLLARDMRLADLLQELGRYRPGVLRCHPAVAELKVSGAFPLTDSDASLRLLGDTLPVAVNGLTRYWVTVEPRV